MNAPTHIEPQNVIEVEQSLLGALMLDNRLLSVVESRLKPVHFFEGLHQIIYQAMCDQAKASEAFTPISLRAPVAGKYPYKIADMTVAQYLARLVAETVSALPKVASLSANQIIEAYVARQAKEAADTAIEAMATYPERISEIVAEQIATYDTLAAELCTTAEKSTSIADATAELFDTIEAAHEGRLPPLRTTGLSSLDRLTGGLPDGNLIIVAGRPGMGKSALALSMGLRVAKAGEGVLFFSLEMPARELAARACVDIGYSSYGSAEYETILKRPKDLSSQELDRIKQSYRMFQDMPFQIDDHRGLNIGQIATRARRAQMLFEEQGKNLGLVVVDHIGKLASSNRYKGQRTMEVTEISGALADLAAKLGCAVVAVSQLNRSVEARDDKRPNMGDLRDSGALEQDAHIIIFPFRESYYLEKQRIPQQPNEELEGRIAQRANVAEIIVAKNRNGRVGMTEVFCDISRNRFDCRSVR